MARAARLGAGQVLLVPGRPRAGTEPARARAWLGEGLRGCVAAADRLGLTPTIENLGIEPALSGAAEHLLELCEAAGPGLRVTYDAGNFLLAGEDALTALTTLAPRVVHVHLKDWALRPPARERHGAYLGPTAAATSAQPSARGWSTWVACSPRLGGWATLAPSRSSMRASPNRDGRGPRRRLRPSAAGERGRAGLIRRSPGEVDTMKLAVMAYGSSAPCRPAR